MNPDRPLPDFIIAGCLKSGTTALARYLGERPDIYMSVPKEVNFFCDDFPDFQEVKTLKEYRALFDRADVDRQIVGEGSVRYLYSETAARNIAAHNPDTRIIVMVRNPIEMVYSFHSQLVYEQLEAEEDFERAWAQEDRASDPFHRYREVGRTGTQIERLLREIPREQVLIVVFDDFAADTGAAYRRVLDFLGVPDDGRADFPAVNRRKSLRSRALANLIRDTPTWLAEPILRTKRALGISELGVLRRLDRANIKRERRRPLNPSFHAELSKWFADEISRLSVLTGRDLSPWLEQPRLPLHGERPKAAGRSPVAESRSRTSETVDIG